MITVNHQFQNRNFYVPEWKVKYLFLGTFNPEGGEEVPYFYGRPRNQTWPILRELTGLDFDLHSEAKFFENLREKDIACMDMIHAVDVPEFKIDQVLGKGYSDSKIINGCTQRQYNTKLINQVIENNKGIQVFSTWGKGPKLKEWREEIAKIKGIIPLVSPSKVAKVPNGVEKYTFMFEDWSSKIIF